MRVINLKNDIYEINSLGSLSLINTATGLPCIAAALWSSLNELNYSDSYLRKNLYAISKFYEHVAVKINDPKALDRLIINCETTTLILHLRTFVGELQNHSWQTNINHSRTLRRVINFIIDTTTEISIRRGRSKIKNEQIFRELTNLTTLYRFLKPNKYLKLIRTRSIPNNVLDKLLDIVSPNSDKNPFRTRKLAHRNYIVVSLLYQMGLRRGELLNLRTDSFKSEYCKYERRQMFWLNVKESNEIDPRNISPRLKNEFSPRQIPMSEQLFMSCHSFISNWRGKCSHGYLISSSNGLPLSERGLNSLFTTLSSRFTEQACEMLKQLIAEYSITPHALRHSSAVYRINAYREMGIEMNEAEALLRVFFGWSPSSKMPLHYARAYYEERVNTVWSKRFDIRIETFSKT